jgi:hypothetical protein
VPLTTKDLPGLAEPNPDAPLIYLDQWVWAELALAARSGSGVYADLLGALTEIRASRRIAVALIAANYLELGQRRSSRSRRDVAKVMAEVTGYATLAAIHSVQAEGEGATEGPETGTPDSFRRGMAEVSPEKWEWLNLVGMDIDHSLPEVDYRPEHRLGDEFAYVAIRPDGSRQRHQTTDRFFTQQ